ncbi:leucine-rich repeat-containing protein 15 [Maniola jurtina]|uniref:leucine-rich repeat-containing protein 15 n=1 Tax=Maniola jurtina TaxID=191418 RepID=UPI001E686498|nr:leucine-rich repeat-containing protein 15 [Maniola jurtina]
MATLFRECLILIFIMSWQVNNLISACPKICECRKNLTSCETCPFNVSLKENLDTHHLEVCCQKDSALVHWIQNKANKTLSEVVIEFGSTCNTSRIDFDFPYLDTYSITMKNNSIRKLRISVKYNSVREINLASNKLTLINKGLFANFTNLRKLILNRNLISKINENSFFGLVKLETLDLSENYLTVLTNVFLPLKNLQHLNLSRNNIEFIHNNYFNNWLLQHLDISYNNLKKVSPGALQQLPNLARLLLTDNPHLGVTQLDTQLLVGTGRRLQQIDASRTGLCQVPEAFTHSVRFLSLVGNRITSVRCGDLDSYPLLQSLDFCDNKIAAIEDDSLGRLEMLLFLNMNKNLLSKVPRSLPDGLKYLSINENLIKNITMPDFKDLPNLRILLLKSNQIQYIQDRVFDDLLSLEMLDLSHNPIKSFSPSTFDGPLSLRDLRLCYLNLSVPAQEGSFPLSSPENVQMLHLQSSPGLAKQLLSDSAALAAFSHLQYLDLRMNNLTEIRNDLLFYLGQLKTLRLYGNKINCSSELWLSDWLNSNKSVSRDETCYFSSLDAKSEIAKYNCTFPETFTISESLPPVNLYSTEMINRLLRYYGYLNNKTERVKHNNSTNIKNNRDLVINKNNKSNIQSSLKDYVESRVLRNQSKIISNDYLNETSYVKIRESSKVLDQNKIENDKLNINHFLDIEPYIPISTRLPKKEYVDTREIRMEKISGKRLNTPASTKESKPIIWTTEYQIIRHPAATEAYTANPNVKLEYSSFKAANTSYDQYIGVVAVVSIILIFLILWVSFRLGYKDRQVRALNIDIEDQIEVSNISGGVLW